jgi:CubicO group peptidase (beta-lactamase class C family)
MKITALTLLSAVSLLSLTPPATTKDKVTGIAESYLANSDNAGLSIAIISGGKESIYTFGSADRSTGAPVDTSSIFEIGSITKVFTGIMLANEVVHNRMDLNDNIAHYIPAHSDAAQQVTMLQLSTHSSGAPRLADNFWPSVKNERNPYASYGEKELYAYLENMKLVTEPGTRYSYSNVGAGILGNILCKQYGTSYESLVTGKVCSPFGMSHTKMTLTAEDRKHLARGYSKGKEMSNWDFQDATAGQGALRSNIMDMMSFMRNNLKPSGDLEPAIRLAQQTHFTDQKTGQMMGLGWHKGWFYDQHYLEHTGGTGGYRSFIGLLPGTNTGVVVLSNSDKDVARIGLEILKIAAAQEKENRKIIVAN